MKYHLITYGCQMNKSDSERIIAVLENLGYKSIQNETKADLVIINACSVRQSAVDRIYGKIKQLEKIKKERPLITVLTGCILETDKKKLERNFDLVLDIKELKNLRTKEFKKFKRLKSHSLSYLSYFKIQPHYTEKFRAFVPIMTGCNNFCSYCVVPYTRGKEMSRPVSDVLDEIKKLAKNGCLEITLLGQNVNAYRSINRERFSKNNPYKEPFAALLWEINQIKDIKRIHFTAPHPKDMSDEVIDALTLPKQVNYLHLPVQSGDDEILRRMNRNYTCRDYLKLIQKIRDKKPDIALGTDIIVGFPGENRKQFENTVKLYKKVGFDIAYLAMYSPRARTAASKMVDDVSRQEKKCRWHILQNLMEKITFEKNRSYIGKTVSVLVDEYKDGWCFGNSREMKRVRFPGKKNMIGKIFNVKVSQAYEWILEGVCVL